MKGTKVKETEKQPEANTHTGERTASDKIRNDPSNRRENDKGHEDSKETRAKTG